MKIKTLESFNLSDSIKFHDQLNPKLFVNNKPRPEVKKQLLIIAKDFISELGIKDIDIEDLTISGSNAAYTYTKHSDLDLHILVDYTKLPDNEVYRELLNAKKIIYNDTHDIKVHGIPVELYVQDSNEPVISLGEYSLLKNKWLRIPVKRQANLDQTLTRHKYNKLYNLVQLAIKTKNLKKIETLLKTMRRYRQAGLDKGGEFSPENLSYKMLRSQGWLTKLYKLKDQLHSKKLSIENIQENKDILHFKKLIKEHTFELKNIPTLEEYDTNRQIREKFTRQIFKFCWENKGDVNYSDIMRRIQTKIWKTQLVEGSNVTRNDISKFIKSLWKPIPVEKIKPKMVVDTLSVQHKTDNIISLSISENKKISQIYKQPDGSILVKFTDGDITMSNWENSGYTTDVYFFTEPKSAAKGIEWILLSTDRVNGYRTYGKFLIDLPNEGPYDRIVSKIKEQLDKPTVSPEQLAKYHNISVKHILAELNKGIKVELEHTSDKKVAKEIALDHLKEDPNYYTKLLKANLEEAYAGISSNWNLASANVDYHLLKESIEEYFKKDKKHYPHRIHGVHQLVTNYKQIIESVESEVKEFWNYMISLDQRSKVDLSPGKSVSVLQCWTHLYDSVFELRGNLTPKEIVDVDYDYDGKVRFIQFMDGTTFPDKSFLDRGQGPSLDGIITIFYPTKRSADQALTLLYLNVPNNWKLSKINLIESSLTEASGYIPSEKEKNDPRFKTALTIDIKPDTMKKDAKKFGNKISRAGIPPTLRSDGKF